MTGKIHFVSAGAGSGKTYRLTRILHEQLAAKRVRPEGVIATTFTRKAAAELRERVRAHLLEAGEVRLASAMGQARIGTVNAVCGELLQRFAFEAGLGTDQQVLDERQVKALLTESIDAVLDGPAIAELLKITARLGFKDNTDWQDALRTLVDQARANDIDAAALQTFGEQNANELLSHFPKPCVEDLSRLLQAEIECALPTLRERDASGGPKVTKGYLELAQAVDKGLRRNALPWSDWAKLAKTLPEVALRPLIEPIAELAGRVAEHAGLHKDLRDFLERMFALGAQVLSGYQGRKREMGVLDFVDQERLLLKVLDDESVIGVLEDELDLLLVDEFQDTSPIQLALFIKLARHAREIYWVGDVKQAIYGFRGSDSSLMEAILQALPALGGDKEILGSSWRSRPPLVQLVNAVFGPAFASTLAMDEVVLHAERSDAADGLSAPAFANWVLGGKNMAQEQSALAAGIRKLVQSGQCIFDKDAKRARPLRYGDIAVLARSNGRVAEVAVSLRAQGVPSATAQPGLLATPEATLALACLRRLNDAADTVASAVIVSMTTPLEPEAWVADRLGYLAAGGRSAQWMEHDGDRRSAHPIVARLAALRERLLLLTPAEALRAVVAECGLVQAVLRWKQDAGVARVRLANLEALQDLAADYEEGCRNARRAASVSGLILWLSDVAEEEADHLAEPAIDAVKVMTHHAAKGLEWPVVLLMDLASEVKDNLWSISARSRKAIDVSAPLDDRFIRYWPWPFGQQKNVGVADDIANTETAKAFRQAAIDEHRRLLYVSMTRARDLLVLVRSGRKLTGDWLDTLDAPCLLPTPDQGTTVTLPDGSTIAAQYWQLDPPDAPQPAETASAPLHWFETPSTVEARLPLVFNPSAAGGGSVGVLEQVHVGHRIAIEHGADMTAVGTAVHACIAMAFADRSRGLTEAEVERVIEGQGVRDYLPAGSVLDQIQALLAWIEGRWGAVTAHAEYPVQHVLDNGQRMHGRIDLLLDTADGWVLIDHKSSPFGADKWPTLAAQHAGQMRAYGLGVEAASGRKVKEHWLFLPVAGAAVRI